MRSHSLFCLKSSQTKRHRRFVVALVRGTLATCLLAPAAWAGDWITAPSYFTHNSETGERVSQYAAIPPVFTYPRNDFRRSGYRQTRSSIQAGGSADHMHIVEEWGNPVRPYGEWRFPYRPYSVPYDAWGPPVPQVLGQGGFGGGYLRGYGGGYYGGAGPDTGVPPAAGGRPPGAAYGRPYPGYYPTPQDDGRYAPYDSQGPYGYPDLLQRPPQRHRGHRDRRPYPG